MDELPSFCPAFLAGLINAKYKQKVAQFVWLVPTAILAYKLFTFSSASSVLQANGWPALHQYFGGDFLIPEFRDWNDLWRMVESNSDMTRGMAQITFTAPFYAGIGYSVASWIGIRTNLNQKLAEKVKIWERSRFDHQE